jgi:NAD(P)-dependent dehydrogenase (short-subunit alcohol dehydrogenase family)
VKRLWTAEHIPSQAGKTAIVTGGSSGLGFETARALARAGAQITIASQNRDRGVAAVRRIRAERPSAQVDFEPLDVSSLASVAQFAERMLDQLGSLDVLVNCAGIGGFTVGWRRRTTVDGFERAFATNYLGHFALTGRLLPALTAAPGARVISVSSLSHWFGRIDFDDLQLERRFWPTTAYERSKLALIMFGLELHRRARAAGLGLLSVPVHPGVANTDIFQRSLAPGSLEARLSGLVMGVVGQPAASGALPILYAATAPEVESGRYYGPDGPFELRGRPAVARLSRRARDPALAARLWEVSERLTGVVYRFGERHEMPPATPGEIRNRDRPASL